MLLPGFGRSPIQGGEREFKGVDCSMDGTMNPNFAS